MKKTCLLATMVAAALSAFLTAPSTAATRSNTLVCAPGAYVTIANLADRTTATCAPLKRVGKAKLRTLRRNKLA